MTRSKRRPGDTLTCAHADCPETFVVSKYSLHQLYCSKRCRDLASRLLAAARDPISRNAAQLRMEAEALGGTDGKGNLVCGTRSLERRPVIEVGQEPDDDGRFW